MTAEPRDVEEIRADLAHERPDPSCGCVTPGCARCMADSAAFREWRDARKRLVADVEPLLARLAVADRENAELRGEVERLTEAASAAYRAGGAAAQAQLAEAQREAQEDSRVMLESAKATIALIKQRAELEARLEAVRSYLAMARATESTDHAAGWNLALTAVGNRIAALSAAPQPEPDENACRSCGIDNPVWFAPNEVWNAVMGDHTGFLCPRCFIVRAEASGMRPTAWVLTPEPPTSDEPTGRSD